MSRDPLDLGCLRLFDAAARHENLSHAAAALGMTQPALSYRIRRMEERLGLPLFERRHRGLALSPAGRTLHEAVRDSLERLDQATAAIAVQAETPVVRLATDYAFAALWLMPRVAGFRAAHPGIAVQIVASQELAGGPDGGADLAVLFGGRDEVGAGAERLIAERVTAVCSPAFLAEQGPFESPQRLGELPLLHLEGAGERRWYDWESWLAELGVTRRPGRPGLGLNTYTLVIQAALAGQGVALGWLGLVDGLLESGALVRAHPAELESPRGYWLVPGPGGRLPAVRQVADWIRGRFAAGA
ncbi:putative choline sulfate-utilization transcription factor [Tistlia consotensis]|uniref:Putative choline sulfate-utilization transcription factor n=1 Tax=Tistlia consotensis USBA 355 TaxID=560819 RepID=A0A1Y6BQX3_9PROT|nr:LysR substrate-binding domain-containing protein [Tistlia consotensis]SMF24552.1 putative choline sulfate-utilization transcription factor [Tistlia consotensis USBA 355]SNR60367.1 putative choline sulfate-utilization transcription factor [Tistlia consotensis]